MNSIKIPNNIEGYYRIIETTSNGIIIRHQMMKIFIKTNILFNPDDLIYIQLKNIKNIINDNHYSYLHSKSIFYICQYSKINIINSSLTIKQNIYQYFNKGDFFYTKYVPLTLFGQKNSWNQDIYNKLKNVSIIHLFVISGFHINFWILLINKLLIKIKIENKWCFVFILLIFIPYLWLINFSISSIRAFLFSLLIILNKHFWKNKFEKIDLLTFVMMSMILINPNIVFSLSFIFSFLLSYTILLCLKGQKKSKIIIYFFIWIMSSILVTFINHELNINGLINNIIFMPLIILIYFLTSIMFFIKPLINNIYYLFDTFINFVEVSTIKIKLNINLNITIALISTISIYLMWNCRQI